MESYSFSNVLRGENATMTLYDLAYLFRRDVNPATQSWSLTNEGKNRFTTPAQLDKLSNYHRYDLCRRMAYFVLEEGLTFKIPLVLPKDANTVVTKILEYISSKSLRTENPEYKFVHIPEVVNKLFNTLRKGIPRDEVYSKNLLKLLDGNHVVNRTQSFSIEENGKEYGTGTIGELEMIYMVYYKNAELRKNASVTMADIPVQSFTIEAGEKEETSTWNTMFGKKAKTSYTIKYHSMKNKLVSQRDWRKALKLEDGSIDYSGLASTSLSRYTRGANQDDLSLYNISLLKVMLREYIDNTDIEGENVQISTIRTEEEEEGKEPSTRSHLPFISCVSTGGKGAITGPPLDYTFYTMYLLNEGIPYRTEDVTSQTLSDHATEKLKGDFGEILGKPEYLYGLKLEEEPEYSIPRGPLMEYLQWSAYFAVNEPDRTEFIKQTASPSDSILYTFKDFEPTAGATHVCITQGDEPLGTFTVRFAVEDIELLRGEETTFTLQLYTSAKMRDTQDYDKNITHVLLKRITPTDDEVFVATDRLVAPRKQSWWHTLYVLMPSQYSMSEPNVELDPSLPQYWWTHDFSQGVKRGESDYWLPWLCLPKKIASRVNDFTDAEVLSNVKYGDNAKVEDILWGAQKSKA